MPPLSNRLQRASLLLISQVGIQVDELNATGGRLPGMKTAKCCNVRQTALSQWLTNDA